MPLNASSPYAPVLTGIGLLQDGKISQPAIDTFVANVALLLTAGNHEGKTLIPIASVIPLPPVPGPKIAGEDLFWFDPDPVGGVIAAALLDRNKSSMWHAVFIDLIYSTTATLLDLAGNTPLFPIFDPSAPFGVDIKIPYTPPELASKLKVAPPQLLAKLAGAGIKVSIPAFQIPSVVPPLPQVPKFDETGKLLSVSLGKFPDAPALPDLVIGLIQLPIKLLINLVLPPSIKLVADIPNLPKLVFTAAADLLKSLLDGLGLVVGLIPKTLLATLIVYLKNVVAMVCVVIVSQIVGTGNFALGVGQLLGLVT